MAIIQCVNTGPGLGRVLKDVTVYRRQRLKDVLLDALEI